MISNQKFIGVVITMLFTGGAAASSVRFNSVATPILSPVCTVNIGLVNCGAYPPCTDPNNCTGFHNDPVVCSATNIANGYSNTMWGYGQPNMNWFISGNLSGPDGVYVPPPPVGSENPKNVVNVAFFKNTATTPLDPFFGAGPISFYLVPTCIHVEQNNQGTKLAVVRLLARLSFFGVVVEEPELWLITQDQNGQDRIAISAGSDGTLTTCTVEDARNSVTDPEGIGLPPNPPGYTSDNLFELLSPITSGNITPRTK